MLKREEKYLSLNSFFSLPSIHLANGSVLYDCHIFPSVFLLFFFLCEMNNLDLVEERHIVE